MPTVNITQAPIDLHRRTARVLPISALTFEPLPGQPLTLLDGADSAPGYVYAVNYRNDTATLDLDVQLMQSR